MSKNQSVTIHSETLVSTLRKTYGPDFAPGIPGETKVSEIISREAIATMESTAKTFRQALKNLADK
jgi:hypothetical protein